MMNVRKGLISLAVAVSLVLGMLPADRTRAESAAGSELLQEGGDENQNRADEIEGMIGGLLDQPFTRSAYGQVMAVYSSASDDVKQLMDVEMVNSIDQLKELVESADAAIAAINQIELPGAGRTEGDYVVFVGEMTSADDAMEAYLNKYTQLRQNARYEKCLPRTVRDALITNSASYDRATYYRDVETAYHDVGDFSEVSPEVRGRIQTLKDAIDKAGKSTYQISVYDLYNGTDINGLLTMTGKITQLEDDLDILPDAPTSTQDLSGFMRAYQTYNAMSKDEQALLPASYKARLDTTGAIFSKRDEAVKAINDIGVLATEADYEGFSTRYEAAYRAYQSFISAYKDINGIADLVENSATLDKETFVYNMVRNIRDLAGVTDAMMCSRLIQMEEMMAQYSGMDEEQKKQIYNISVLDTLYADTKAASDIRSRIEAVRSNFTLEDEKTIAAIRADYDALNEKAKAYVGQSWATALSMAEKQLDTLKVNEVQNAIDLIDAIGTVNVNAKPRIDAARAAYDKLPAEYQAQVTNYSVLTEAENTFSTYETSIEKAGLTGIADYTYTGQAVEPAVVLTLNGETLRQGADYTVAYSDNTGAGTAKILIKGVGNYTGTIKKTFTIRKRSIGTADVSGIKSEYSYTGKKIKPDVKVVLDASNLKKKTDYTVSYFYNKKVGKASVVVQGTGNYNGSIVKTFKIKRAKMKNAKINGLAKVYSYTGNNVKPYFTVKVNGVTLKRKKDYRIIYLNNRSKGKATVIVKGKGNYRGTKTATFKIR